MSSQTPQPVVAFIFARGGSKGVPGKNLRSVAGLPLIAHSIHCARRCPIISRVIVSTDSEEIAAIARAHDAEVPFMRPEMLARDNSPELLAWRHAVETLDDAGEPPGTFVSLPATSPLRSPDDVEGCLNVLIDTGCDLVLTITPAHRSPFFNMVTLDAAGRAGLLNGSTITRRQDAPVLYDVTTVAYAATPAFVRRCERLWDGDVRAHVVPAERALDIDTEWDLKVADLLMREAAIHV